MLLYTVRHVWPQVPRTSTQTCPLCRLARGSSWSAGCAPGRRLQSCRCHPASAALAGARRQQERVLVSQGCSQQDGPKCWPAPRCSGGRKEPKCMCGSGMQQPSQHKGEWLRTDHFNAHHYCSSYPGVQSCGRAAGHTQHRSSASSTTFEPQVLCTHNTTSGHFLSATG